MPPLFSPTPHSPISFPTNLLVYLSLPEFIRTEWDMCEYGVYSSGCEKYGYGSSSGSGSMVWWVVLVSIATLVFLAILSMLSNERFTNGKTQQSNSYYALSVK